MIGMTFYKSFNITLQKQVKKILQISLAYDDTFVLLGVLEPGRSQCIIHCTNSGKFLHQFEFKQAINYFQMISQNQLIFPLVEEQKLVIINLQTQNASSTKYQFHIDKNANLQFYIFNESHLVCLKQQSMIFSQLTLTYLQYPLKLQQTPIFYKSKKNQFQKQCLVAKVNNHSMVAWWRTTQEKQILLNLFDIARNGDTKGIFRMKRIKNTLGYAYGLNVMGITVGYIWEVKPEQLILVCTSIHGPESFENTASLNQNFIVDLALQTVRPTKFCLPRRENQFFGDCIILDQYIGFQNFSFEDSITIYLVNNRQQVIISQLTEKFDHKTKFYSSGFDKSSLLKTNYELSNVNDIEVTTVKCHALKQIILQFLLHINLDFDDDLLFDSLDLLQLL